MVVRRFDKRMIQPEINKHFSQSDIVSFVINNDTRGLFKSAALHKTEFAVAVRAMNDVSQVIVWRDGMELKGVLGWCFTTEERKHELSKQVWRLPQDIVNGDILYLSFIATKGNCDVLAVKKMFEDMGYRKRVTKRRGFTKNGWYEKNIYRPGIQ